MKNGPLSGAVVSCPVATLFLGVAVTRRWNALDHRNLRMILCPLNGRELTVASVASTRSRRRLLGHKNLLEVLGTCNPVLATASLPSYRETLRLTCRGDPPSKADRLLLRTAEVLGELPPFLHFCSTSPPMLGLIRALAYEP